MCKCDFKAIEYDHLGTHQQPGHEGEKYVCGKCNLKDKEYGNVKKHEQSNHERVNSCSLCKKIFITKCGFNLHMNKDHPPLIGHCKEIFLN